MTTTQSGAQYVYGIIRSGGTVPDDLVGLDDRPVSVIRHGDTAALVSDLPQERPLGRRADLLAHQRVLDALVGADVVIMPFRFGAALSGVEAVENDLLATNGERLGRALDRLDGRHEVRVKATYVEEAVLREVMAQEPAIAELNERLRSVPEDAADAVYYDRIRLGELVTESIKRRRDEDGARLLETLRSGAAAVVPHTPVREEDILDASFLVDREKLPEFEQQVARLGEEHGDRVQLRLIGPLPPYDFVPEE